MANAINVAINVTGNASPQVKKVTINLKEMGEKASQVGMRMGAAFTLPLVGLAALVGQSKEVQAALKPVTDEFTKIGAQVGTAFLPVIKEAVPLLMQMAKGIEGVVGWFSKLDPETKNTIVSIALFAGAAGPVITTIGQIVQTAGILKELLPLVGIAIKGVGVAMGGAAIPILAVSAALIALYQLVNMTEFKQVLAMAEGGWTMILTGDRAKGDAAFLESAKRQGLTGKKAMGGPVTGGMPYVVGERGPEMFVPGQSGAIIPNNRMGSGQVIVNVSFPATINTASPEQIRQAGDALGPVIQQYVNRSTGRR